MEESITDAFGHAFFIGIKPKDFWELTPYQLTILTKEYKRQQEFEHDAAMWRLYHAATFHRAKKLPPLSDYLSTAKKNNKNIDENAILIRLKVYQERLSNAGNRKTIS